MNSFKFDLFEICKEVAASVSGWSFVSGQFKNKSLRHTDQIVYLGLGFDGDTTSFYPGVTLDNKRSMKLCKSIIGYELSTSTVSFQAIANVLKFTPERLRHGGLIVRDKDLLAASGNGRGDRIFDLSDAKAVLVATLNDGISFIEDRYNLSNEESLLRSLPVKYEAQHPNSPYDEFERQKGVMLCLIKVLLGDFDFVEWYRGDGYKTIFPKRMVELDKIAAALPALRKRYEEIGSVI